MTDKLSAGTKSSEFWATLFTVGVGAYLAHGGLSVDVILAVTGPVMVYTGSRAHTKANSSK